MRRRLLTLGDDVNYRFQRHRLAREARKSGWFDRVDALSQEDISDFLDARRDFVERHPAGMGLWAWKPRIILDALMEMEDGEMLVYLDAGSTLLPHRAQRLEEYGRILSSAPLPVMAFAISTTERALQKMSVLRALGLEEDQAFLDSGQAEGGALVALACEASRAFVEEWLGLCTRDDHSLLTSPVDEPQPEGYINHRHDQSLLSALAKMRGAVILPGECYGTGPFFHSRMDDNGFRPLAPDTYRREPGYDLARHPTWSSYLDDPPVKRDTMDRVRAHMERTAAGFPPDDPDFDLQGEFFSSVTAELERIQFVRGLWKVLLSVDEPPPDSAQSSRAVTGEVGVWMRPGNSDTLYFRLEGGKIIFLESKPFVVYLYKKEWSRQWDFSGKSGMPGR